MAKFTYYKKESWSDKANACELRFEYPLAWPPGRKHTPELKLKRSPYRISHHQSLSELSEELGKWGATTATIYSNGEPLANGTGIKASKEEACVVVTWFDGKDHFELCADTFRCMFGNLTAIARQLAALRQAERNGTSGNVRKTIRRPPPILEPNLKAKNCWAVLGLTSRADRRAVRSAYRKLALQHHPDLGGNNEDMRIVNEAYGKALAGASS